jgi:hypothetical protein
VLVALRAVRAEATDEVRVAPEADPGVRRHERRVRDGRLAHHLDAGERRVGRGEGAVEVDVAPDLSGEM